jgi:YfiH family protein
VRESDAIVHPILARCGVAHGFGTRTSKPPSGTFLPRQVHGVAVHHLSVDAVAVGAIGDVEADAICTSTPGQSIGIITADCVPILVCNESGQAVLAVHAGWRGLAQGVIEAGIASLIDQSPASEKLCAVVGPHVGPCCYEVDAPVLDAMTLRFGEAAVKGASTATRPGHARLALGKLALLALERSGVDEPFRAALDDACTSCSGSQFHSYRRDGEAAGRMVHFIATSYR